MAAVADATAIAREQAHAIRNGGSGPHGREHDAAADARRASTRGLRSQPGRCQATGGRRSDGIVVARRSRREADASARGVDHGSGGRSHRSRRCRNWRQHLQSGDTIIDGGNSYFKDDVRRAKELKGKGIHYIDVGTSGGVWGLERGYCMMIGGPERSRASVSIRFSRRWRRAWATFRELRAREKLGGTAEEGYIHCGPSGSGHFVKMVHNGIEYGIMQAYAEGFDIFKNATSKELPEEIRYDLNLPDIAEVWRRGSVVSSWLLDLTAMALTENPTLSEYEGFVQDSGEGRWTIQAAIEEAVPADVLTAALYVRFRSRQQHTFAEKMLSAMRQKFGGHIEAGTGCCDQGKTRHKLLSLQNHYRGLIHG